MKNGYNNDCNIWNTLNIYEIIKIYLFNKFNFQKKIKIAICDKNNNVADIIIFRISLKKYKMIVLHLKFKW